MDFLQDLYRMYRNIVVSLCVLDKNVLQVNRKDCPNSTKKQQQDRRFPNVSVVDLEQLCRWWNDKIT